MSDDFDAAEKRLEQVRGNMVADPADIRRLLAELAAERERADKMTNECQLWMDTCRDAEERAERLEKALREIEHCNANTPFVMIAREALRPAAAPEPPPSEECCNRKPSAPHTHGVGSEQQYLPLGHEFVAGHPHPAYQSYCALRGIFGLCGQPESVHRRKP